MPSGLLGLDTALRALLASQQAIDVVSHNIANVNTPGYSRQQPVLAAERASMVPEASRGTQTSQVGGGVRLVEIRRVADRFLANQVRLQNHALGEWEAVYDGLQGLQAVVGEPSDVGLAAEMDAFWGSWSDLASDPQNTALRSALLESGRRLASKFQSLTEQLTIARQSINEQVAHAVQKVNELASGIATLNVEITRILGVGDTPNDLQDQRDRLLDELSTLINVGIAQEENGAISVFVRGHHIVWQSDAARIVTDAALDPGTLSIVWEDDSTSVDVSGGRLAGLVRAREDLIAGLQSDLDAMAAALASQVNALHRDGFGLDGTTGLDFFSGTTAGHLKLSEALDHTDKLATAAQPSAPGDGSIALQISLLADARVMEGGSASINDYYRKTVGRLGMAAEHARHGLESARILADHLEQRRQRLSGVSLDEETVNLVQYQRAYQAAARMISVIDEMLDRLINGTGRVGR